MLQLFKFFINCFKVILQKVAIIGAGGAGLMAAISSAQAGGDVTIFEKNDKVGSKILISGRGRCNVTNSNVSWKNYYGTNPKFVASVFARFSNKDVIEFFEERGLKLKEEDRGRLFPVSDRSQSVIDVLLDEIKKQKVRMKLGTNVRDVKFQISNSKFQKNSKVENQKLKTIDCKSPNFLIEISQGNEEYFDKVIITTGGLTYPNTGSTGDGYRFAESFGHTIIKQFPVSVPFRIKSEICNKLQGVKVDAKLFVKHNNTIIHKDKGHILFTHLGISGPMVLRASRKVSEIFSKNPKAKITCFASFFPEYNDEEIRTEIFNRISKYPDRALGNLFHELVPKKFSPTVFENLKINYERKVSQISKKEILKVIELFRNFEIGDVHLLDWNTAHFTAGGVDTKEINSQTMESKIVPGLFFAGEVVDIDGASGGYNLTWSWCSGWVAGRN